jgi:hypothetical protein
MRPGIERRSRTNTLVEMDDLASVEASAEGAALGAFGQRSETGRYPANGTGRYKPLADSKYATKQNYGVVRLLREVWGAVFLVPFRRQMGIRSEDRKTVWI